MDDARDPDGAPRNPSTGTTALAWVDEQRIMSGTQPTVPARGRAPDLLARRPRRRIPPTFFLVPIATVLVLACAYTGAALLWPLHNVQPTVTAAEIATVAAPETAVSWPENGSAAVGVDGLETVAASDDEAVPMASITKLVTALMVLDETPLEVGEQGPEREITWADRYRYWEYLARGESALDVPVDGTLTTYQLLQGMLMGSAGNYAELLTADTWPTDAEFSAAATEWLDANGLNDIVVVDPSGISQENVATPAALIDLGEAALDNPVLAEIVATESVELPGAGEVENTNELLDDGAVGLKTGTLYGDYNLLAARDIDATDAVVTVYAVVLGQIGNDARFDEAERLLDEVVAEAETPVTLPAGTVAGSVTTLWGDSADIVTTEDVSVLAWNGASAASTPALDLGEAAADREDGDPAGTVSFEGPVNAQTAPLALTATITDPDGWWRLTHPLELFGLG